MRGRGIPRPVQRDTGDCPALVGTNVVTLSSYDFVDGMGRASFEAQFNERSTNPATTYTIVRFEFDHSYGFAGLGAREGECGCVDRPECLILAYATWFDASLEEHAFQVQQGYAAWQDPNNSARCPGIPDCTGPDCEFHLKFCFRV